MKPYTVVINNEIAVHIPNTYDANSALEDAKRWFIKTYTGNIKSICVYPVYHEIK